MKHVNKYTFSLIFYNSKSCMLEDWLKLTKFKFNIKMLPTSLIIYK